MQDFSFYYLKNPCRLVLVPNPRFDRNEHFALTNSVPMQGVFPRLAVRCARMCGSSIAYLCAIGLLFCALVPSAFAQKDLPTPGIVRELQGTLDEVRQAVVSVQHDHIIHGTKVFEREPILTEAEDASSSPLYEPWQGPGEVFYKIRKDAIAPRHFLQTGDIGTIAVRYVVIPVTADRTRVKVDAVYVETARKTVHASDGSVEKEEMKEIKESLETMQQAAADAADARRRAQSAELVRQSYVRQREDESTRLSSLQQTSRDLEAEVSAVRHDVERRVKAPGADLKAAPFHSAASLKTLSAFTEVVILIVTPHWLGVETPGGQRGWLTVEQLEPLP